MKQKVIHWRSGQTKYQKWDSTDDLNKELADGWKITGYMQPSSVVDPGEPSGSSALYRSMLIILEKEDDTRIHSQ